jgi:hypothetical protein
MQQINDVIYKSLMLFTQEYCYKKSLHEIIRDLNEIKPENFIIINKISHNTTFFTNEDK